MNLVAGVTEIRCWAILLHQLSPSNNKNNNNNNICLELSYVFLGTAGPLESYNKTWLSLLMYFALWSDDSQHWMYSQ